MTPTPSTGREPEIVRAADAIVAYAFEACQPKHGGVFGWIDDHKHELARAVIQATLARQLREALEFYRDNWSVDDTWNPKGGSYPNSALRSDGGQRARQALASLAREGNGPAQSLPSRMAQEPPSPKLEALKSSLGQTLAWLGQCMPCEYVDFLIANGSPGFDARERENLIESLHATLSDGWTALSRTSGASDRAERVGEGQNPNEQLCDHAGWSFSTHGRGCPKCGRIVLDFGD